MRRPGVIAALLSALCCSGCIALWIRSEFVSEWRLYEYEWHESNPAARLRRTLYVSSGKGSLFSNIIFQRELGRSGSPGRWNNSRGRGPGGTGPAPADLVGQRLFCVAGIGLSPYVDAGVGQRVISVLLPWWLCTLAFALPPAFAAQRWHRRRRARRLAGNGAILCANCGYDLRASTGRCPECGQPIT